MLGNGLRVVRWGRRIRAPELESGVGVGQIRRLEPARRPHSKPSADVCHQLSLGQLNVKVFLCVSYQVVEELCSMLLEIFIRVFAIKRKLHLTVCSYVFFFSTKLGNVIIDFPQS